MREIRVGEHAVLVEVADAWAAADLARWARASGVNALDIVPASTTVLFDGVDRDELAAQIDAWRPSPQSAQGELIRVPVVYDGPDLSRVAQMWSCSEDEVVSRHTATEFTALFGGFAPGFSYLGGLPEELRVARLDTPRPRVPAGSVAIADTMCAIYPGASPGGWLILGHTDLRLWDPAASPPALLVPGTQVRFHAA